MIFRHDADLQESEARNHFGDQSVMLMYSESNNVNKFVNHGSRTSSATKVPNRRRALSVNSLQIIICGIVNQITSAITQRT
jgi:hypothetical protein